MQDCHWIPLYWSGAYHLWVKYLFCFVYRVFYNKHWKAWLSSSREGELQTVQEKMQTEANEWDKFDLSGNHTMVVFEQTSQWLYLWCYRFREFVREAGNIPREWDRQPLERCKCSHLRSCNWLRSRSHLQSHNAVILEAVSKDKGLASLLKFKCMNGGCPSAIISSAYLHTCQATLLLLAMLTVTQKSAVEVCWKVLQKAALAASMIDVGYDQFARFCGILIYCSHF